MQTWPKSYKHWQTESDRKLMSRVSLSQPWNQTINAGFLTLILFFFSVVLAGLSNGHAKHEPSIQRKVNAPQKGT